MSFLDLLYYLVPLIIASAVPLSVVALGALFSERSGVVNIALEGIMLMGAFVGAVVIRSLQANSSLSTTSIALIGLGVGAVVGMVFSVAHAFASIHMKSNQIISATALNMFALAFGSFIARTFNNTIIISTQDVFRISSVPILGDIPFIGNLFFKGAYLSTYVGVIIFIIGIVVLYKTKAGLRLRSCGENPQAADSLGINVYRVRYAGVLVSGALAGLGGVIFLMSFAQKFLMTVSGFGFLALAVLIFGNWKPNKIILAGIFFAMTRVLAVSFNAIPIISDLGLTLDHYLMVPYITTLIVLAFVSKNSAAPRAAGEPYDAGKR